MILDVPRVRGERLREIIAGRRPTVLEGLLDDYAGLTLTRLSEAYADAVVPVAPVAGGVVSYSAERGIPYRRKRLADVIADLDGDDRGMLTGRPEEHLPGVSSMLPALEPGGEYRFRRDRIWISPGETITPLHHEVTHNLLAQLEGDKVVTLYSPRERRAMYPHPPWSRMPHVSRVAAHDPDLSAHRRFADAVPHVAKLAPGDVLFIPALWWHWVRTERPSLSHNLWFARGPVAFVARTLERYKELRSLSI
jgi:hypothetical protein